MPDRQHWLLQHDYGEFARMPLCWASTTALEDEETTIHRPVLQRGNHPAKNECERCAGAAEKLGVR